MVWVVVQHHQVRHFGEENMVPPKGWKMRRMMAAVLCVCVPGRLDRRSALDRSHLLSGLELKIVAGR